MNTLIKLKYCFLAFLMLLSVLLSKEAVSQSSDCDSFKEGHFGYAEKKHAHWTIERVGEYQLEYSEIYDVLFVASLEWIDECTYLLQYVSVSNPKYFDSYGKLLRCEVQPLDGSHYRIIVEDEGETYQYVMERKEEHPVVDGRPHSPVD